MPNVLAGRIMSGRQPPDAVIESGKTTNEGEDEHGNPQTRLNCRFEPGTLLFLLLIRPKKPRRETKVLHTILSTPHRMSLILVVEVLSIPNILHVLPIVHYLLLSLC